MESFVKPHNACFFKKEGGLSKWAKKDQPGSLGTEEKPILFKKI